MAGDLIDGQATAISGSFFVEPCTSCIATAPTKSAPFVMQTNALLQSLDSACSMLSKVQLLWNLKPMYDAAMETFTAGPPLTMGPAVDDEDGPQRDVRSQPGGVARPARHHGRRALHGGRRDPVLASDRPRVLGQALGERPARIRTTRRSHRPASSTFRCSPASRSDGLTATRTDIDKLRGYAGSSLTAFERYQGAKPRRTPRLTSTRSRGPWETTCSSTATGWTAPPTRSTPSPRRCARTIPTSRTARFPSPTSTSPTPRSRACARPAFTPAELTQLQGIGLPAASIDRLRADLTVWDPGTSAGPVVLDETLDALATAMRDATEAAEDFARGALVSAGRNNIAPVSHFTTARKSGSFTTFRFTDTSTAGDLDPLTIDWDFGDGTTASSAAGEPVEHTFAVPGELQREPVGVRRTRPRPRLSGRSPPAARRPPAA